MRNYTSIISQGVLAAGLLISSFVASALTVNVLPVSQDVFAGDTVIVTIDGTGFNNVSGGSMDVMWDPTVLTMTDISGVSIDTAFWSFGADAGILTPGLITSLRVGVFPVPTGYTGDAPIATLTFTATSTNIPSSTAITVGDSVALGGGWDPAQTPLVYNAGAVNVSAIPVPAAVWLFGSGLLGLVGVARRRQV